MADAAAGPLEGRHLLVVEDNYMIAADLVETLDELGARIVGPASSVAEALALIDAEDGRLDGATLDINLDGERVYPVADALHARGIPFIFATGYDASVIPDDYAAVPRCPKPFHAAALLRALNMAANRGG